MAQFGKVFLAFLGSVVLAGVLGSIVSTQFVFAALDDIGAPLTIADRLSMTGSDIAGFGPMYTIFILLGFLVAFSAGWLVHRFAKTGRTLVYTVAGLTAMAVMLYAMKNVFFGVQLVAGARTMAGLIGQSLVGAIAGFVFARLTAPKPV